MSIEVQLRAVERVAETNGWEMMWLADEGVSGAVPPESRKRFKAALALLEAGESEALIFTKGRPSQPLHRGLRPAKSVSPRNRHGG